MPIRGEKDIWPETPRPPTGIFSTRGKQKMDPTGKFDKQDIQSYAKGSSTRSKPGSNGGQSLRHQSPR